MYKVKYATVILLLLLSVSSASPEIYAQRKAVSGAEVTGTFRFYSVVSAQTTSVKERDVRKAVQSFDEAFNAHGWNRAAEFTTEDWNTIRRTLIV
jgi:hypothetical protein